MAVFQLDPLTDPRWRNFVERHPRASIFHTPAWLAALKRTYAYKPVAFTTSAPDAAELETGIAFCEIRSWLTGHRLVSLPFSDHCDPLVDDLDNLESICEVLATEGRTQGWTYIELRPQRDALPDRSPFGASERFWLHTLDLRPDERILFRSFSKDSIQRKIQRAEREGLTYEEGRSEAQLQTFYELLSLTRRRHQLPPQPVTWFKNLASCFAPSLKVRVAKHGDRAIAAIVTLRHRNTMVYKYGASDASFHPLGGMHLLFWKTIQDARASGCITLDLGRCDISNEGLATFKERWGAARSPITYWRYPEAELDRNPLRRYAMDGARHLLSYVPDSCRAAAGRLLYRHAG